MVRIRKSLAFFYQGWQISPDILSCVVAEYHTGKTNISSILHPMKTLSGGFYKEETIIYYLRERAPGGLWRIGWRGVRSLDGRISVTYGKGYVLWSPSSRPHRDFFLIISPQGSVY